MPRLKTEPTTRIPLFLAIAQDSRPQYTIAALVDRSDAWLSRVTRGLADPGIRDMENLASVLGMSVSALFPEDQ